ncbi:tail fiber domain-containing protein [Rummeliibacillus stabekisii]|uniref:Peptidase S74 domain-containing protein n=1 Tax=Rummeliibacillus stabekisii TaxID=241244 RepID=A0A143HFA5_9BACL|nr:tail fiber domain-containing protein [Rummeliibacillus stabekisii]AMX00405.1 hypothetical protein ATY39_13890 [Rummeliibacillus stabekisii]
MAFTKQLPEWNALGVEPPQSLKEGGWKAGVKPPADYFNWLQNKAFKAIEELQLKAGEIKSINGQLPDEKGNIIINVDTSNFATKEELKAKYSKPANGIPKSDFASDVQTSLSKADGSAKQTDLEALDKKVSEHQAATKDYVNTRGFLSGSDLSSGYTIGAWNIGTSNLNSASGNIKMGNSTGNIVCNNLTQTSKRELKKNIKSWDGDGYGIVKSVPVRQFQYIDELDEEFPHVGFILDEVSPWMADIEGNGVSVNQTVNILFDALQTAIAKIERLEGVINNG